MSFLMLAMSSSEPGLKRSAPGFVRQLLNADRLSQHMNVKDY